MTYDVYVKNRRAADLGWSGYSLIETVSATSYAAAGHKVLDKHGYDTFESIFVIYVNASTAKAFTVLQPPPTFCRLVER